MSGTLLSRGGNGDVHAISATLVVKVLPPHATAAQQASFRREHTVFNYLAREGLTSHPRIVRCVRLSADTIVLERLPTDLYDALRTRPRAGTRERLRWAVHAAQALRTLHGVGVVHADVATQNFMVTRDGSLKIIDFGGCAVGGLAAITAYRPRNAGPAVIDDLEIGRASDIFALGSVLFEIETGRVTYEDLSDRHAESRFLRGNFEDVSDLRLGRVIEKCWRGGYRSVQQVLEDLERVREDYNRRRGGERRGGRGHGHGRALFY